ncbi:DUF1648 domain-containing protein [Clostridium sp.]|uniref:DUF1648 domain-containing protein n=1 Tax=Clostridium sp. TaxID=1506 RepID=UPI00260BA1A6|nr:DUF1648 domain-containing protein [Clostridium sp.]
MNEQVYLLFVILVITGLILWQNYRINDFNIEGITFGVRVPEKYRNNNKVISISKEYNKLVTILTLINAVIFFCIFCVIQRVYIIIIYSYILVLINLYAFSFANRKLKGIKEAIGWEKESENKVYIQIGRNKDNEKLNFKLFYIAAAISILGLLITISKLPSLPKMVPIHFGINGPDNWADSTTLSGKLQVIMLPIVSIVCIWSMMFSAKFQAKKDNSKLNGGTISSLLLKKSYSIKSMTQMLGLISIGVSLMILYGILLVVGIIQFTNISNYIFIAVTVVAILFPLIFWMYSAKRIKALKAENNSMEKEIYKDDDEYYLGGIFYYNQNDPSNIVKRRMGYGLDFNYARILGKVMLVLQTILLVLIVVFMIAFSI